MTARPILFSAPMIRALLDGRKTQTRRMVKPQPLLSAGRWHFYKRGFPVYLEGNHHAVESCPYGKPGDLLWCRETWQHGNAPLGNYQRGCLIFYRADYLDDPHGPDGEKSPEGKYRRWIPSLHLPRRESRITLRITDVRVQRLNDISPEDAAAEGWPGPDDRNSIHSAYPIAWFWPLWESINGKGSWDLNPWVWALNFEVIRKNVDEVLKEAA